VARNRDRRLSHDDDVNEHFVVELDGGESPYVDTIGNPGGDAFPPAWSLDGASVIGRAWVFDDDDDDEDEHDADVEPVIDEDVDDVVREALEAKKRKALRDAFDEGIAKLDAGAGAEQSVEDLMNEARAEAGLEP